MGRGKKKDDEKKAGDAPPSTSQAEENEGLTGGGLTGGDRTKSTKQTEDVPSSAKPSKELSPSVPKDDGLSGGLTGGLTGGGGKSRPKKKKTDKKLLLNPSTSTQDPANAKQVVSESTITPASETASQFPEQKPASGGSESVRGPGRGRGRGFQVPGQHSGYKQPQAPGPHPGYQQPQAPGPHPGYPQPQAPGPHPGYQQPQAPGPHPGYQQPQAPGPHPGYQQPQAPGPHPGYQQPQAPGPHPGYQQPQAPGPHPGYQQTQAPGPHPGYQQPRAPGPHPGYQRPQAPGPHPGYQQPQAPGPHPGYQQTQAPGPHPGYQQPQAPGPHPGYQQPQAPGPHPGYQQPQAPGPHPGYQQTQAPGPHPGYQQPRAPGPHPGYQRPQAPGPHPGYQQPQTSTKQQSPVSDLTKKMSETTIAVKSTMSGLSIPHRYNPPRDRRVGVPYKDIKVLTNYLCMNLIAKKTYRYDVSFKPDRPKKFLGAAFNLMVKAEKYPKEYMAFDQVKNCYSLKKLPNVPENDRHVTNVEIVDSNGRKINYEVSIKFTGTVDSQTILDYMKNKGSSLNPPAEAISCLDVVLRQGTLESYVKAGRQFFKRPSNPVDLSGGLEMWTGLFQSAIFTSRAFINIDVAHKGFPRQQPLVVAMEKDFRLFTNKPVESQRGWGVEQFEEFIRGLRVIATIGGDSKSKGQKREFICNGLVKPPKMIKFKVTDNGKTRELTVADYFRERGINLRYPDLNCVWVGPRDKTIYYPMELLEVAYGQVRNRQLNEMQLSTMVKTAAAPPKERKAKIDEVKQAMNYSQNQYFKKFGLEISNEFFEVGARLLKPPTLDVGNRQTLMPRGGSWQANTLLRPEPLNSWGFICLDCDGRIDYEGMIRLIKKTGIELGMQATEPALKLFSATMRNLRPILLDCLDKNIKFLFIIVATRGRDYYQQVKRMAELDVGILTQCVKENTAMRRMNFQTVKNILLKVNSKLMGINQALNSASKPACLAGGGVMVVGADVTHPSPDQPNVPSIAAVTASIDPDCYRYNIELSVQTPKREMIMDFEEMMFDHFKIYKEKLNHLPKKIFYFRDGVSEGQFSQVMDSEIPAMHRAYARLSGGAAKPEVLFLLVQKRHHTRFFLGSRDCQNVEPGTVVDEHIVHASELDFYMVSHQAIKGTARPTRYHAVCNDGKIPYDEVEQLTYYLCHLFSRCMRAVSYPTPTYYAHLACFRAKALTFGDRFNNAELERKPIRLRVLDRMLQYSRMFYV